MHRDMSKPYLIRLPDLLAEELERWAEHEGNKPTSLAAFIVESEIRAAMADGRIPQKPQLSKDNGIKNG